MTREEILQGLADAVIAMDEVRARELAELALAEGIDAYAAVMEGLSAGMEVVSGLYDREEYFVPEILLCADAMYEGLAVLRPHLRPEQTEGAVRVVIGVIEGDIHDIGKNVVRMMMEGAGFVVHDLGRDVPITRFVEAAEEFDAQVLGMSTLMSTTRPGMGRVVERLRDLGVRDRYKVIIGGGPISASFAAEIGADACGADASAGVRIIRGWFEGAAPRG